MHKTQKIKIELLKSARNELVSAGPTDPYQGICSAVWNSASRLRTTIPDSEVVSNAMNDILAAIAGMDEEVEKEEQTYSGYLQDWLLYKKYITKEQWLSIRTGDSAISDKLRRKLHTTRLAWIDWMIDELEKEEF